MSLTKEDLNQISNLLDQKLRPIEVRLDRLEARMDKLEARMDKLESRMDQLESRMDKLESRMDKLETWMDSLEARMDALESTINSIGLELKAFKIHINEIVLPWIGDQISLASDKMIGALDQHVHSSFHLDDKEYKAAKFAENDMSREAITKRMNEVRRKLPK
jgi:chromosome segregation ATPase